MDANMIPALISQHRSLQKDLGAIDGLVRGISEPDTEVIEKLLEDFMKVLVEHLDLENNHFYAELLEGMRKKGQNTTKTEAFINEMGNIEKGIVAFVEKYKEPTSISNNRDIFERELENIMEQLNLRIESEEAGVYAYWGLF